MSHMGVDPGDLTPDEMYGREPIPGTPREDDGDEFDLLQTDLMGNEAGSVTPLIVHATDCTCQGDGLCLACAIEDDAAFAVFCKRTGMDPNQERAA
jgi:hypothetical protein